MSGEVKGEAIKGTGMGMGVGIGMVKGGKGEIGGELFGTILQCLLSFLEVTPISCQWYFSIRPEN